MGKYGSSSFAVLLIDGYDLLAAKLKGFTHKIESKLEPTTGLGDSWEAHTPTGMRSASLTQDGAFFDDATTGMHAVLNASQATSRVMVFAYAGNTIGRPFVGTRGVYGMTYDVLGSVGELTKANVSYQVSGAVDRGVILQELEAKTIDWNTKTGAESVDYTTQPQRVVPITSNTQASPTVITTTVPHGYTSGDIVLIAANTGSNASINGQQTITVISTTTFSVAVNCTVAGGTGGTVVRANSASGGVGYLAVSAASGFTNFVGKIRDSADDTTYADLIAFTDNVTAPYAERIEVSGTVDRYLSFDGNVTGSGSITAFCGFSRS